MAAPDITLPKPYVLIQPAASTLGIYPTSGSTIKFGTVALVYSTSDRVAVSQSVVYDSKYAQPFMYGSTMYYLISDEYVVGQENPLP